MNFPLVHTNFWDAVLAIPCVMILTQISKLFSIPRQFIPTVAIFFGLVISIFYSHPHDLVAGFFMGYFYGYAAMGNYSALKTSLTSYRNRQDRKANYK